MSTGKDECGSGMLRNELAHFHPVFGIQLDTDNDLEGSPHLPADRRLMAMAEPMTSCISEPMIANSTISHRMTRGTCKANSGSGHSFIRASFFIQNSDFGTEPHTALHRHNPTQSRKVFFLQEIVSQGKGGNPAHFFLLNPPQEKNQTSIHYFPRTLLPKNNLRSLREK